MFKLLTIVVGMALVAAPDVRADEPGFKVVVNAENPIASISRADLAKLFLKRTTTWENGNRAQPVDQPASREVRSRFSKAVLEKSVAAVEAFWQQRIFSGRDIPPPERPGDAEVVGFVSGNPNAIGYVSAQASTAGVKVIPIRD